MAEEITQYDERSYNRKFFFVGLFAMFIIIAGIFLFREIEGWNYIDSFYFTVVTLTTIGYGDIVPITNIGKIATSIYALLGVAIFLFCVGVIAEHYFFKRISSFGKIFTNSFIKKEKKIPIVRKPKLVESIEKIYSKRRKDKKDSDEKQRKEKDDRVKKEVEDKQKKETEEKIKKEKEKTNEK
jgi:hypothetical protein